MRKKLLSVFVLFAMALSLLPVTVLANEPQAEVVALKNSNQQQARSITVTQGNPIEVKIAVGEVSPSVSGEGAGDSGDLAFWVGVGIVSPGDEYHYLEFAGNDKGEQMTPNHPNGELDDLGNGKRGFAIWLNAGNNNFINTGAYYTLKWMKASGNEEDAKTEVYHIKLGEVSLKSRVISKVKEAPLSDRSKAGDYELSTGTAGNGYTSYTLKAHKVVKHTNGTNEKYWVGVGFVPIIPEGSGLAPITSVRYKTADDLEKLNSKEYQTLSPLENDVIGTERGIAIYVDADKYVNSNQSRWIAINWAGSEEIFQIKFDVTIVIGAKKVTFDPNGGQLTGSATATTDTDGTLVKMPSDPTRDGYDFDAWYTVKADEGGYKVDTNYTFRQDTTVYARWKEKTGGDTGSGGGTGGNTGGGGGTGDGGTGSGGGATGGESTAYSIQITSGIRHGTVSTSHTAAEPGTWVTLTVSPESDYALDWIDVDAENGRVVSLRQSGRRYSFTMPASDVTVDAKFSLLAAYNTFIPPQSQTIIAQTSAPVIAFTPVTWRPAAAMWDVPARSWAYPAAQWAYQNGYLDTASDGTFRLDDTVSHIQLWRIMARWLGEPAWDDDSASQWARKSGAAKVGSASSAMTRQNMVEYLYQCYFLMGGDVTVTGNLIQYRDSQQVTSTSAKNAWLWAVNKGIISGTSDGSLNPNGLLSRAEFASILMRLCQKG